MRNMVLEPIRSEERDCQLLLQREATFFKQPANLFGVKIKIELHKFDLFMVERVPLLFSRQPTRDCLEVAFIRELQNENGILCQHTAYIFQRKFGICHVVQGADHRGAVK